MPMTRITITTITHTAIATVVPVEEKMLVSNNGETECSDLISIAHNTT